MTRKYEIYSCPLNTFLFQTSLHFIVDPFLRFYFYLIIIIILASIFYYNVLVWRKKLSILKMISVKGF